MTRAKGKHYCYHNTGRQIYSMALGCPLGDEGGGGEILDLPPQDVMSLPYIPKLKQLHYA